MKPPTRNCHSTPTLSAAVALLACLLLPSLPAAAADPACDDKKETWQACFNRLVVPAAQKASAKTKQDAQQKMKDQEAGAKESTKKAAEAATASDDKTASRDFLTSFLGAIGLDGLSQEDGDLRFVYNVPESKLGGALAGVGVEIVAREPELYSTLTKALEESQDPMKAKAEDLESQLGDFDDISFRLRFSFFNDSEGKGFGQSFTRAYNRLFREVSSQVPNEKTELEALLATVDLSMLQVKVGDTPAAERPNMQKAISEAATAVKNRHTALLKALKKAEFHRYGELLANQPQLYLTAEHRRRAEVVQGPDSYKYSLTYEWGRGNLNGLRRACDGAIDITCYTQFIDDVEEKLGISSRWKAEVAYEDRDSLTIDGIAGIEAIDQPSAESWTASVTYGRLLPIDSEGDARFDLSVEGEDVSDDPAKQNRLVATGTVSRKIGEATLAVSLVWASKPEFRGDVDEELSARAGLKFSFDSKKKKETSVLD